MPFAFHFCSQVGEVFDDAVVNNGQHTGAIRMWVGIDFIRTAMRGPACMPDAQRTGSRSRAVLNGGHEIGELPGAAMYRQGAGRGEDCNARGVIAAVFEFAKAFKQYGSNIGAFRSDVANDTAHVVGYPFFSQ